MVLRGVCRRLVVCLAMAPGMVLAQLEGQGLDLGATAGEEDRLAAVPLSETGEGVFGEAGTWTFLMYGSAALADASGQIYTSHTGVGYYFRDNLSINVEFVAGGIDIDEGGKESSSVYGGDLLLRWHYFKKGGFSSYVDVGAGFQQSSRPFPIVGTHFNFRPQTGLGITLDLNDQVKLMTGARWLHVSNAGKNGKLRNPGYDAAQIYMGLMIPF